MDVLAQTKSNLLFRSRVHDNIVIEASRHWHGCYVVGHRIMTELSLAFHWSHKSMKILSLQPWGIDMVVTWLSLKPQSNDRAVIGNQWKYCHCRPWGIDTPIIGFSLKPQVNENIVIAALRYWHTCHWIFIEATSQWKYCHCRPWGIDIPVAWLSLELQIIDKTACECWFTSFQCYREIYTIVSRAIVLELWKK
jgi:hypothetical protein